MGLFDRMAGLRRGKPGESVGTKLSEQERRIFDALVSMADSGSRLSKSRAMAEWEVASTTLPEQSRLAVLVTIAVASETQRSRAAALHPFLFRDSSFRVRSTAALHYTVLHPGNTKAKPLTGMMELIFHVKNLVEGEDFETAASLLHGLVSLGDRRITEQLVDLWAMFDDDLRCELINVNPEIPNAAVIDWQLAFLANAGEPDYGQGAASLCRAAEAAEGRGVVEWERVLPLPLPGKGEAILIKQRWSKAAFAKRIQHRLVELAEAEPPPRLMPSVMRDWGL